jgi:ABC-2 type transport system ATP-binding protein
VSAPNSSGLAIETTMLCKLYDNQLALDHVELRVPDGSVYVLVGANGAGKSTTFKVLMNLERPDMGNAAVFGLDTALDGPRVRARIGYVPEQSEPPYKWMTCARLLQHAATYYPSWDIKYAEHLVKSFQIRMDRKTGSLSKGEARRLQLVMAMAYRPAVLLLDEPTEGLDPVARRQLLTFIAEHLADSPTTIVVATHHVYEVESLADHIGVLNGGRLIAQMSRDEVQRTVRRYHLELTNNWQPPGGLLASQTRTSADGRDAQWTVVGDQRDITERLTLGGARVLDTQSLTFEEAALALLSGDVAR